MRQEQKRKCNYEHKEEEEEEEEEKKERVDNHTIQKSHDSKKRISNWRCNSFHLDKNTKDIKAEAAAATNECVFSHIRE